MTKVKFVLFLFSALFFTNCSSDDSDPVNTNKSVRYYAIISPTEDTNVLKTVTYTDFNGNVETENVAIFNKTISVPIGTVVSLSASGSTTGVLNIIARVEIYIDNQLAVSQQNDGPGAASATATVTVQ